VLVNEPVPVPSEVFESLIVGFAVVAQQTPRAVTGEVPSSVITPPVVAVVDVVTTALVVKEGAFVSSLQEVTEMAKAAATVSIKNCFFIR
jgi:hypothetical protein